MHCSVPRSRKPRDLAGQEGSSLSTDDWLSKEVFCQYVELRPGCYDESLRGPLIVVSNKATGHFVAVQ